LGWCSQVSEAAEMYRRNEDRIGIFLSEETNENPSSSVGLKIVYGVYRQWSEERGERPLSQGSLQKKLTERGVSVEGTGARAVIKGRSLIPRAVQSAEIDWSNLNAFNRSF
jgi:phage/plasmid-associated DNA primase